MTGGVVFGGDGDAVVALQDHLLDGVDGAGPGKGNHGGAQQFFVHFVSVVEVSYPVALVARVAHAPAEEAPHVLIELVRPAVPWLPFQSIDAESDVV